VDSFNPWPGAIKVNTAERVTGNKINQVWLDEGREETQNIHCSTKEDSYLTFQGAEKSSLVE
jgi:hypothetical protein